MSRHESQNEKILDQFTQQAQSYAELTASRSGGMTTSPLFAAIAPTETDRVLDVACGSGRITVALAHLTQHVTGIDLTQAMIDQADTLKRESGVTNITFRVGDVLSLPFADRSFSLVVSQAAFHHVADPVAVLKEMARVCTADGRIAVNDMSPVAQKADALNAVEKLRDPSHVRALPPAQLQALGAGIGLITTTVCSYDSAAIPLDAVLDASFPNQGDRERVRERFEADARSGENALDVKAHQVGERVWLQYPMTVIVWKHARV